MWQEGRLCATRGRRGPRYAAGGGAIQLLANNPLELFKELANETQERLDLCAQNFVLMAHDIRDDLDAEYRIILVVGAHEQHEQLDDFIGIGLEGFRR